MKSPEPPRSHVSLASRPGPANHSTTWFWESPAWEMPLEPCPQPLALSAPGTWATCPYGHLRLPEEGPPWHGAGLN